MGLQPSLTFGDFHLTIVSDGPYFADGGAMFGVVPKTLWEKKTRADALNRIVCGTNSVLVRTGNGKTVLIETGIGSKLPEKLAKIYDCKAQLLNSLAAAGVRPEEIDIVINSHLHFDHCGWNTHRIGNEIVPTFPNAKYFTHRGEWEHGCAQYERDRVSYISGNYDPLIRTGQMQLLDGDGQIMPGISVALYPGHTRNMMAILLQSGGKTACYISDLIPTTAHLDLAWVMAYDLYPLETIQNRKRFYSQALPEDWLVIFTHDHETPWAYLQQDERGKMLTRPVEVEASTT
jgi:glyoxylase-like metal-dependent hydrolase (beta-lactamase superfamily II)